MGVPAIRTRYSVVPAGRLDVACLADAASQSQMLRSMLVGPPGYPMLHGMLAALPFRIASEFVVVPECFAVIYPL